MLLILCDARRVRAVSIRSSHLLLQHLSSLFGSSSLSISASAKSPKPISTIPSISLDSMGALYVRSATPPVSEIGRFVLLFHRSQPRKTICSPSHSILPRRDGFV